MRPRNRGSRMVKVSVNSHAVLEMIIEIGSVGQLHRNVTIGALPDDILLEIFCFYMDQSQDMEEWIILVHVCQRWRNTIFTSPRRLNLRLLCEDRKPVRELLNIWPALPIVIRDSELITWCSTIAEEDYLIAAFEHKDRVCEISLRHIQSSLWESFSYCLGGPFPALERLELSSTDDWDREQEQDILDSFGSAPNLNTLSLKYVPCPSIPPLLLSASGLVHLHLLGILGSEDISPGTMATCLSTLTKLETFTLQLPSSVPPPSSPRPTSQHLPLATRTVLPFLSQFQFEGPSEYLEVLLAFITAPLLRRLEIVFDGDVPILGISQVSQFIGGAEQLNALDQANVVFHYYATIVTLLSRTEAVGDTIFEVDTAPSVSDWPLVSLARIYSSTLPSLFTLERLDITEGDSGLPDWIDNVGNPQWLDFLHCFAHVKNLHLSEQLTLLVAPALQELVAESRTDVLPTLQSIFLEGCRPSGHVQEAIEQFVATRRHSGCPVAVHHCEREKSKW
jgi:hypothetical protein